MNKPEKITRTPIYDFNNCADYIEHKYSINIRDFAGKFTNGAYLKRIYDMAVSLGIDRKDLDEDLGTKPDITNPEVKRKLDARALVYKKVEETEPPYQDFWHWVIDQCEVNNGGTIWLSEDMAVEGSWEKKILDLFMQEFGEKNSEGLLEQEFLTAW